MKIYKANKVARDNPRVTTLNGKAVGIGGSVNRIKRPPKLNEFVPEATPEEYEALAHLTHLVECVEASDVAQEDFAAADAVAMSIAEEE